MSNLVVNTNILALNAYRALSRIGSQKARTVARLSSGLRINSASDDAAGLAISERMRAQIRGLNQASRNTQDAISAVQTADGGLSQGTDMLQRMRELVVQGSNDTLNDSDREKINVELNQLSEELKSLGTKVHFNNKYLLSGKDGVDKFTVQTGANAGDTMVMDLSGCNVNNLGTVGMAGAFDITGDQDSRDELLKMLDKDLDGVSTARATLGAYQNRLEFSTNFLDLQAENLTAAESRIRDADMAKEMMEFAKLNVLEQAAMMMLAQANQSQQGLLRLLQG